MEYNEVTIAHTDQAAHLLSQGICLVTGAPEYQERLRNRFDMSNWSTCFYGTAFAIANDGLINPFQEAAHWVDDTDKAKAVLRLFYWAHATDQQIVRIYLSIDDAGWIQQAGEDWSGQNLSSLRFKDANFAGASFRRTYFSDVNFDNCNLSGTDFTGADLTTTGFDQSSLANANFGQVSIDSCRFFGCDLSGADFSQVRYAHTAHWYNSTYDEYTKFPEGFDPSDYDMTLV
jgi:uncharacterized protein YjbI with pentapeptide repeats